MTPVKYLVTLFLVTMSNVWHLYFNVDFRNPHVVLLRNYAGSKQKSYGILKIKMFAKPKPGNIKGLNLMSKCLNSNLKR